MMLELLKVRFSEQKELHPDLEWSEVEQQVFHDRSKRKLSKEPISLYSLVKNINSVINTESMEKMTSTVINKWLLSRGLLTASKVPTTVNKTVFSPSELASKIGIKTEPIINKVTGEVNPQIKFSESAQLFIIENIEEIFGCV